MRENSESAPKFQGFLRPDSAGNFTMVPNQFFDEIVPNEPASVTKLVGLVIRRTIGWADETGQRRQEAQISYSEFQREMNMTSQTIAAALQIALNKGYIVKVREGCMNSKDGSSVGAFYSLTWFCADGAATSHVPSLPAKAETSIAASSPAPRKAARSNNQSVGASSVLRYNQTQAAHSNNQSVQEPKAEAAHSNNQSVTHSNNQSVEAGLERFENQRDINKESLELINKVEIKSASVPDSTFNQIQTYQEETPVKAPNQLLIEETDTLLESETNNTFPSSVSQLDITNLCPEEENTEGKTNSDQVAATDHTSQPPVQAAPPEMYQRPGSVYIQNLVRDLSRDFEDVDHAASNISQALNLWATAGCDERDFTIYLYEARKRTRANLGPSQTKRANRMPYFFSVLRDLLKPASERQSA